MLAARADAVAEEISITFWGTTAGGEGLRKPGMPIGGVIGHDVDDHFDVGGMQRHDHRVEVNQGTEPRIDVAMIINVVTTVGKRRRIERGQPHRIDTKRPQVRDPQGNARQIPDAITVAVGKAARVDLIHHRPTPDVWDHSARDLLILIDRACHSTSVPHVRPPEGVSPHMVTNARQLVRSGVIRGSVRKDEQARDRFSAPIPPGFSMATASMATI